MVKSSNFFKKKSIINLFSYVVLIVYTKKTGYILSAVRVKSIQIQVVIKFSVFIIYEANIIL